MVYDDGASYNVGRVIDISDTGLFLRCVYRLPIGAEIRLESIEDIEDPLFEVRARVTRSVYLPDRRGNWCAGLEFLALEARQRAA
jgi:hypothetical protein